MKIEELMIYGYGKFENQRITLEDPELQVIYGENEAGKSTIMSFIHSILFGFPTKLQTENRYEPKNGSAYGGYLIVRTIDNTRLKIERRPGKAGGELKIESEQGDMVKEEYLQTLLGGIDRETYKSIFSFDIHGLQQVQKLNSDQIGKFLFLSSIYGADALFAVEHSLIKQQDSLYKPSGKRPVLNEALSKLKESNSQLLEAKRKNNEYQYLADERESLEEQLHSLDEEKKQYVTKQRELEKLQSVLPMIREKNWCLEQLRLLPDTAGFPEDGLKKLDHLLLTLQPMEAQLHSMQSKIRQYEAEEEKLIVNETLLHMLPDIHSLREQLPLYKEKSKKRHQQEQSLEQLQNELALYKQRLYPHLQDEDIVKIPATVPIKESIKKVLADDQHLKQRKEMLDSQFEQAKTSLEEAEWKLSDLEKDVLSDAERISLENEIAKKEALNPSHLKTEHQQILSQIKQRKGEHNQEIKQRGFLLGGLSVLLLIIALYFSTQQNWLVASILISGMILACLQVKRVLQKEDPLIIHLREKQQALERELSSLRERDGDVQSLSKMMNLLEKDNKRKQEIHHEQLLHKQHEKTYDRVLKLYEEWEKDQFQCSERIAQLAKQLKLEKNTSAEALLEAFDLLQHLQQLLLKKQQLLSELKGIKEELVQYEQAVAEAKEACGITQSEIEEAVYELMNLSSIEADKNRKRMKVLERKAETIEAMNTLTEKISFLKQEKGTLLKKVDVEDEEEFRKLAKSHLEREELNKQLLWIEKQLTTEKLLDLETIHVAECEGIDETLLELEKAIEAVENSEKAAQQKYSSVIIKLKDMEQSGMYSHLRHAFENEKAVVREYAEQWVIRALAKDLLNQTVERHRKTKLPALITYIELYFKKLTSNKYRHVFLPENKQSFIVERKDGISFYAEELSQATAEQLYLSIRLALIKSINEQIRLPIMIDDSFVHFDHQRTANSVKLLQELKQENQVIYFTCHQHMAKSALFHHVINLSEINAG
ncbi:AAA family ATPase [Metabacillus sp. Hm71]|uniref:AAA family ATPase n=1 Tax=Metabacillus sp. Hm71 TaxID=3450743 RepID=UPI003F42F106